MNYYRLTFNRITTPDPARPRYMEWHWYDLVIEAENRTFAVARGRREARAHGVTFVDAIKLFKAVGAAHIKKGYVMAPLP